MLQCVAMRCSVLQRVVNFVSAPRANGIWICVFVAVFCNVLQCVAVCCSALPCVAVGCSALQCVAVRCSVLQCVVLLQCEFVIQLIAFEGQFFEVQCVAVYFAVCCSVLQCAAVCCSVVQCVAVCCNVLQCVALYVCYRIDCI